MGGYEEEVRARLAHRAEAFLWSVEHLVFAHGSSPYRPLLDLAGYDLPRLKHLVAAQGLDAALDRLREDGVYVRIEEYKGRAPVIRRGRVFHFRDRDFANPRARELLHSRSSGSRGAGTPTAISADDLLETARTRLWLDTGYGLTDRDVVVYRTPGTGAYQTVSLALQGRLPLRWFSPLEHGGQAAPLMLRVARLAAGVRVPPLEVVPASRLMPLVRFVRQASRHRGIIVDTFVNSALRIVLAAAEAGVDLGDVAFAVGGEPLTAFKRHQIESRGHHLFPRYAFSEIGIVAWACPAPAAADDLHVMTDRVAVRQYRRATDAPGPPVDAYLFTSLLPHARHVLLNAESGDYGILEERACGCFLDRAGLTAHMNTIRSFEKLTAEGVTFIGPSVITLLEEELPREFGGDSRHYQLVEAEDDRGFTRLYLLASPSLGPLDEAALRNRVLTRLGQSHIKQSYGRTVEAIWDDARTVQVLRRDPLTTVSGKVLHLHRDRGALSLPPEQTAAASPGNEGRT